MYTDQDLWAECKTQAMRVANIYDESDIEDVDPMVYISSAGNFDVWTIWMFGNKKIYEVTLGVRRFSGECASDLIAHEFCQVYRFKNIANISYDRLGCVITINDRKRIELRSDAVNVDNFDGFCKAMVALWDEYDD